MKCIELTRGLVAIVDDQDFAELAQYRWHARWNGYAARKKTVNGKQVTVYMHNEIIGKKEGFECDHRNRNPLDNRRENLRHATVSQNAQNRKPKANSIGMSGVTAHGSKFQARARTNGKRVHLGIFSTPEDAKAAYDQHVLATRGEFARLN